VTDASNASLGYPVVVAEDAIPAALRAVRSRGAAFVVLTDANPHVVSVARRLRGARALVPFALGERKKRLQTLECVLDALARADAERSTLVVGVGGGVASDLFGLAAALYMRGVPYAHVATSLVAMADAAIGGKTAVDLRAGKNLAGAFSDPVGVFAHVGALRTLARRSVREGLAEILKAAVIAGDDLFALLERYSLQPLASWPWPRVVSAGVGVKCRVVGSDPAERGRRALLNLGHTFGHAFEHASGYRITHGAGVALGLRAAGLLALRLGRFSLAEHLRVVTLLERLKMPARTSVDAGDALAAMAMDKKRRDGSLRFVLPNAIGDVEWDVAAPQSDVRAVLRAMRRSPGALG
jgi:3-dehydroquinate synthetase